MKLKFHLVGQLVLLVVFSLSTLTVFANSKVNQNTVSVVLKPLVEMPSLAESDQNRYGYVLLNLDVEGISPSFVFYRLKQDSFESIEKKGLSYKQKGKDYLVKLDQTREGYYFMKLKKGMYQISELKAPYFNLPFRLDTSKRVGWRFTVEENSINYLGLLNFEKERGESTVDINLINRIATDYKEITKLLPDSVRSSLSVRSGLSIRDEFNNLLNTNGEAPSSKNEEGDSK